MEKLNTALNWVNANWHYIVVTLSCFIGGWRLLALVIRATIKPEEGSRLDGFCDIGEGVFLRTAAILEGLNKIRKGKFVEGVNEIVNGDVPPVSDDKTPIPGSDDKPGFNKLT